MRSVEGVREREMLGEEQLWDYGFGTASHTSSMGQPESFSAMFP